MVRVVRLWVGQGTKCNGGDIRGADEWDFPVAKGAVDLAFACDGRSVLGFGVILYSLKSIAERRHLISPTPIPIPIRAGTEIRN